MTVAARRGPPRPRRLGYGDRAEHRADGQRRGIVATSDAATQTKWVLKGTGYEFCNCNPGCTCNFSGFPTSSDGSCKAFVANRIEEGHCGDVDLSGLTVAAVLDWPKAIHDGGG